MMPVSGTCRRMSTGTCSSSGGLRMQAPSRTSSSSNRMSKFLRIVLVRKRRHFPPSAEAKEEFEFWVEIYESNLRDWPRISLQTQAGTRARRSCLPRP